MSSFIQFSVMFKYIGKKKLSSFKGLKGFSDSDLSWSVEVNLVFAKDSTLYYIKSTTSLKARWMMFSSEAKSKWKFSKQSDSAFPIPVPDSWWLSGVCLFWWPLPCALQGPTCIHSQKLVCETLENVQKGKNQEGVGRGTGEKVSPFFSTSCLPQIGQPDI